MTQKRKKKVILASRSFVYVFLTLVLLVPFVFAAYEEPVREDIFLVRPTNQYLLQVTPPTYLSTEDLTFYACIEYDNTPVRLSVLCNDNNDFVDVPATKWGDQNCFVGSVDLTNFPCYSATITADYINNGEDERLTKAIRINKVTSALQAILQTQYQDGGWASSLDTAFALNSLKPFDGVFNDVIQNGLLYLKNNRNEQDKCWPKEQCQISTTAYIAYLIGKAGYNDDLRIMYDTAVYLEKEMSYIQSGENYTVTLEDFLANENNSVNTSCVFGYNSENQTLNLSHYGTQQNITISPEYGSVIRSVCTENINVDITSSTRGKIIHYEGDNLSYTIPGPCWTYNNQNVTCDIRATSLALAAPISDDRKTAASNYLASQLVQTASGSQFPDGDVLNLAAFLSDMADNTLNTAQLDQVKRYLLYSQTNEGSWNDSSNYYNYTFYEPQDSEISNLTDIFADNVTNSIVYTAFAHRALLDLGFTDDNESVVDAERWVSVNEQAVTQQLSDDDAADENIVASYTANVSAILSNPKRTGPTLDVLKENARPMIKSSPAIIVLDKQNISVDLINPTTFTLDNLQYQLPSDLAPYVNVEEKDYLAPYSFRRITITQVGNISQDAFGYLRILSGTNEYAKIPLIIESYPTLSVTFPGTMTVFGTSAVAPLDIVKSNDNFTCLLNWNDSGISTVSSFNIEQSGAFNLPLQFSKPATEDKNYSGVLTCSAKTSTFTFPFSIEVQRFLTNPMSVNPSLLLANSSDQQLTFSVKNLLDQSIDVAISLRNQSDYLDFSDYFLTLYPGQDRNVTVFVTTPKNQNISFADVISVRTFNIEDKITVNVDVTNESVVASTPVWLRVAIIGFIVGAIAILGYYGYSNRKKILAWYVKRFRKESELERVRKQVLAYEQRGEAIAVKNMMQILKMEGMSDKEIRARLIQEGFSEEEIGAALKFKEDDGKPKQGPNNSGPAAPGGVQRK